MQKVQVKWQEMSIEDGILCCTGQTGSVYQILEALVEEGFGITHCMALIAESGGVFFANLPQMRFVTFNARKVGLLHVYAVLSHAGLCAVAGTKAVWVLELLLLVRMVAFVAIDIDHNSKLKKV